MTIRRTIISAVTGLALIAALHRAQADDWQPILPAELAMTVEPAAPGAPAIYLYRQVDRDDQEHVERVYERIKVLTEAGRDRANVQLQYSRSNQALSFIRARVIHPDGSIVIFDGKIDNKALVSVGDEHLMAKTFTLPMVTVGSILELRYTRQLDSEYIYDSHWILNSDLFTLRAKFSLKPAADFTVMYSWPRGLPPDTDPPTKARGMVELETRNVPAFVTEEFMPPENELKFRVDFVYNSDDFSSLDQVEYWKHFGKAMNHEAEHFMDQRRTMTRAVAETVDPADDAQTKLRKLYARVLQFRNTSVETELTEQERAKLKTNDDVEDVWNHGYGTANQLTLLYAALVRAAGINADIVYVSTRDQYFFNSKILNSKLLNAYVVLAPYGDKQIFLDPGIPFTRFGLLPWFESDVAGLKLDKDGGKWVSTSISSAFVSRVERHATLNLQADGTLVGKLQVTYSGLDASWRRYSEHLDDAAARAKFLEDEIRGSVPVGINITLTSQPDWDGAEQPLVAEFDISIPGWAQLAGSRLLLPMAIFTGDDRHTFEHEQREHPIYFRYLNQRVDSLDIALPAGYQLATPPAAHDSNLSTMAYHIGVEQAGGAIQVQRSLIENAIFIPATTYPALRAFFQSVRAGDEQQLVLNAPSKVSH